jgi:hypothetical protein
MKASARTILVEQLPAMGAKGVTVLLYTDYF